MTKISQFPNGTAPTGTEKIPALQGGLNVLFTVQDIANKATGGAFVSLAAAAWDFTTGTKKSLTLAANTAITISGSVAGQSVAVLFVTQDATGSRTLSIAGATIAINTAANSKTLISIIDLGGGLFGFDTNVAGGAYSSAVAVGGTLTDLMPAFAVPTAGNGNVAGANGIESTNFGSVGAVQVAGSATKFQMHLMSALVSNIYINVWRLSTGTTYNRIGRQLVTPAMSVIGFNEFAIDVPFAVAVGDIVGVADLGTNGSIYTYLTTAGADHRYFLSGAPKATPLDFSTGTVAALHIPIKIKGLV